jgi:hypothetical protein
MDFQSLATLYRTKTDEELLQLAAQRITLIAVAQMALSAELAIRKINLDQPVAVIPSPTLSEIPASSKVERLPALLRTPEFIHEVLRFYHRNRRIFIVLVFPAVLIGYGSVFLAHNEARAVLRDVNMAIGGHQLYIAALKIQAISLTGYCASWMAFSVSFAAICVATEQIQAGQVATMSESLKVTSEKAGSFLRLSLLLFALYVLAIGMARLLSEGLVWAEMRLRIANFHLSILLAAYAAYALGVIVLSRFGLAIPALILDDHKVGRAMLLSDELTENKWLILSVLLFKSIVGGYVAGMLPFWLARWIPASINLPSWFPWVLSGFSIAALTLLEPVMFIGFALLYLKTSEPSRAEAPQAIAAY